ncbi:FtsX-like permease family protein [Rhodocytophaga rosea]|uniref:FtsX-like permease family protein n=1 Tax=Rhodocytophaga rosea TaxID=2704465 RepID=A0A6C0GIH7_9BACT|nr:ABC transporter permease [Rhodocytophaga rosea]QHT67798.1 FtsX-like permease family protein [Rhodocytophaga rosea]
MNHYHKSPQPPKWATTLLEWRCPDELLEEIGGDLQELFEEQVEEIGEKQARKEYMLAVLRYLQPFAFKHQPKIYPSTNYTTMFQNYITVALRHLKRNRVFSIINISGLSLGLACCMLIFLYTKDEVSYDRFHDNNPNIYRITKKFIKPGNSSESKDSNTGYLQGPIFASGVPEIQSFVRFQSHRRDIKLGNDINSQEVFLTDPDFFSVFTFPLLAGNPKTALQEPPSVVISEDMARKHFGSTDVVGKTLLLKDSYDSNSQFEPYAVTGVARKSPQNSSIKFDVLLPIIVKNDEIANKENWFNSFLNTFVVLQSGADIKSVEATMDRVYQADAKEGMRIIAERFGMKDKTVYALQPFTDMHLNKELPAQNGLVDSSNPMFSYILSGIALFILLIACINFINLTVARSLKRAKEIGVRKVIGGDRTHLMIQFLGESFVLCFIAFVLAILLVQLALPTFNQLSNKALALSYLFDAKLVLGYIGLFLITGLLAGFYPAVVLSSYNPVQTLYSRFKLSGKNYLQKILVILQFSLASFLIMGTLTIYSQFNYLTTRELGYDDKNVIGISKSNLTPKEAQLFRQELLKNPAFVEVAPKNGGNWYTIAKINGDIQINFKYETVDQAYLPLFNIPIVQGRNFSADFPADSTQSVLVNETFVKKAEWKDPIGQEVNFWYDNNQKYKVIGVVKDHHFEALNTEIKPQLFTMKPSNGYGMAFIKIKPGTETSSLNHLEKTYKQLFPINPYSYEFKSEENLKAYEAEAKWKQIILFGTVLTIFISCIGLFGLATLSAERRTKEIGIRKVLGASVTSIVQLLTWDFLKLVSFSFLFAFPAAWYAMQQWLQNYPYQVDIKDWAFILTAGVVILVAFFTVSFQSIKAARINPAKNLRSE